MALANRTRRTIGRIVRFAFSLALATVMIFPFYTTLMGAFKTNGGLFADPFGLPNPPVMDAWQGVLSKNSDFFQYLGNSVLVAALTIGLTVLVSFLAALALSRIQFRGRAFFYNFFIMGMLFPLTVAVLPLYLLLRDFSLLGNHLGIILPQVAFSLPLSVFIFTGFFKDVPWELQDAVQIDGGGLMTFGWRILLPLSTPVISTVTIITFISSWNQFLLPLLVLSDRPSFTLPLGVMQYQGQFASGWNLIMAFVTLSMLPMVIFYIALQRWVVAGLTAGAVKG